MSTFNFPPEIEDEIFQWAARIFPAEAHHLSVISKRVQLRVEEVMYETLAVCLNKFKNPCPRFVQGARIEHTLRMRSANFFANHVRNVYFTAHAPRDIAKLLLTKCTGIGHLEFALDVSWLVDGGAWLLPLSSTLETLVTGKDILKEMADYGTVFPNLKYLAMYRHPEEIRIPPLHWLPALTTIRIDLEEEPSPWYHDWFDDVMTAINTSSRLRLMIFDIELECLQFAAPKLRGLPVDVIVRNGKRHMNALNEWISVLANGFVSWQDDGMHLDID